MVRLAEENQLKCVLFTLKALGKLSLNPEYILELLNPTCLTSKPVRSSYVQTKSWLEFLFVIFIKLETFSRGGENSICSNNFE